MKKFFILFFASILIIAIAISTCTGSDSSYDEEDYEEVSCQTEVTMADEELTAELPVPETLAEEEPPSDTIEYDASSIEIPRMLKAVPDQVLCRVGYTTSYNNETKNANWVAWHLTRNHTDGPWRRDGIPYSEDYDVKGARQELNDWYGHSLPIDHGHICPAGDCKWSEEAMVQSFLLTNMCPQNSDLNRGDWEELESRCRGWAKHYGEIYITAGPIFYANDKTIGNKLGVPDAFYKVVYCPGKKPKALGFIYPNEGAHHRIAEYVRTVDEVEEITGIDFFYNLPDEIENAVEAISEISKW